MSKLPRLAVSLSLVAAAHAIGSLAHAEPPKAEPPRAAEPSAETPEARATRLKAEGDKAFDQGIYDDALKAYDEAYAAAPSAALLYNRARSLQLLARYPEALPLLERFGREAPQNLLERVPKLREMIAEVRAKTATVTIHCTMSGAVLLVDHRRAAVMPSSEPVLITAGEHEIEVTREGYFPFRHKGNFAGGANAVFNVELGRKDSTGLVVVRSSVPGTRVSADGKAYGTAPTDITLTPGNHEVLAESEGYDPTTTHVQLLAGETRPLSLDPRPRPSIFGRWWFWTGVAVVVAGAVVTYVALTTERSPDSGNFSPGLVKF